MSEGAGAKALRGLEVGTKAGYLVLAGVVVYALFRIFGKREQRNIEVPPIADSDSPEVQGQQEPTAADKSPEGIVFGGRIISLGCEIVDPPANGSVWRGALRSTFPATLELVNRSSEGQTAVVEVVGDFHELTGGTRDNVHSTLGPFELKAHEVRRVEVDVETGDLNQVAFEFGQANATFHVYVGGELAQVTYFYVR